VLKISEWRRKSDAWSIIINVLCDDVNKGNVAAQHKLKKNKYTILGEKAVCK